MPVSVDKLVTQANARIALGNQDAQNLARLVGVANVTDAIYSVPTTLDLPAAADNVGRMIYVEDLGVYRYSNGTEWTNDYDTSVVFGGSGGTLFSWGRNLCGELGDLTVLDKCSPVQEISSSTNWSKVSSGGSSQVVAIKTDGTLWSWGQNISGQLGDNTTVPKSSPVREISSSTNWCTVSTNVSGVGRTHAIKTDGTLWSWGSNSCGRLGTSAVVNSSSPVQEFCSATNWCQVSAGGDASAAIKTDGTLWSWGLNGTYGALGINTNSDRSFSPVREISSSTNWCTLSVGSGHSLSIKTDGTLWSWGQNNCGQLGIGTYGFFECRLSPTREISSSTNWCQVKSGGIHSFALKTDGTLWSWGANFCGAIGDGTVVNKSSPVQEISSSTNWCTIGPGQSHTSAIKTDGSLWSWGRNLCGELGDGTATSKSSPVQEISSSTNWCAAEGGGNSMSALKLGILKGFNAI